MKKIGLRPVDPDRDFDALAALFTVEQPEASSGSGLKLDYGQQRDRVLQLSIAEDDAGVFYGFNWLTRSRFNLNEANFDLIVPTQMRKKGAGTLLLEDVFEATRDARLTKLTCTIRDDIPDCRTFLDRRGFLEKTHRMSWSLDLLTFDDSPYDEFIDRLKGEGFQFTSMEELGNGEEAQLRLYDLNTMTGSETMGADGAPDWTSFEDFQQRVCGADWYKSAGELVVIDSATGIWAAMSAITRFTGSDYAYHLMTGVDKRYRGRNLAQAVRVLALRYARDILKTPTAQTDHNTRNLPMLAISKKFGYTRIPGTYIMEKLIV
jgi:RimJ/RimL family protein N-acetyltransferase